jgi:thiamine biosynthesis lipoprotein
MISETDSGISLRLVDHQWVASFGAMASPCEIQIHDTNKSEAERLASLSYAEAKRIEQKFSRYLHDNVVHRINNSDGKPVVVDEETSKLLQFADQCFQLSEGLFDVTSGVLRRAWEFKGGHVAPDDKLIESLRILVGWEKVVFDGDSVKMLPGMEIDLGGVGKEYAADRIAEMVFSNCGQSLMVNLGGDIRVLESQSSPRSWLIGIEDPTTDGSAVGQIQLSEGAVATSGDTRRYCYVNGVRLGHILDPRTGWPVVGAPQSVTVLADRCLEAGLFGTLAMLQGAKAEKFLSEQGLTYHCVR